jgi:hypothetical protein
VFFIDNQIPGMRHAMAGADQIGIRTRNRARINFAISPHKVSYQFWLGFISSGGATSRWSARARMPFYQLARVYAFAVLLHDSWTPWLAWINDRGQLTRASKARAATVTSAPRETHRILLATSRQCPFTASARFALYASDYQRRGARVFRDIAVRDVQRAVNAHFQTINYVHTVSYRFGLASSVGEAPPRTRSAPKPWERFSPCYSPALGTS